MKIRTIMTAAAAGILLTMAGSSLAFGADWVCPGGYGDCQNYEYCTTHDHGDRPSSGARGQGHHASSHGCGSHHR